MAVAGGPKQAVNLMAVLGILFVSGVAPSAFADVIDANSFTHSDPGLNRAANDFELTINGKFTDEPTSNVFPNHTNAKGVAMVTFSGANLDSGKSHNVKFKSDGFNPNPTGQFTLDKAAIGGKVQSFALNGKQVTFVPAATGFDLSLVLANDLGSGVTGNVNAVINQGSLTHFNLDEFDTLRNARPVLSLPNLSLASGEGIPIAAHLDSIDEYILIQGSLNRSDGVFPFQLAFSNAPEIPEPSTLLLLGSGLAALASVRRRYGTLSGSR